MAQVAKFNVPLLQAETVTVTVSGSISTVTPASCHTTVGTPCQPFHASYANASYARCDLYVGGVRACDEGVTRFTSDCCRGLEIHPPCAGATICGKTTLNGQIVAGTRWEPSDGDTLPHCDLGRSVKVEGCCVSGNFSVWLPCCGHLPTTVILHNLTSYEMLVNDSVVLCSGRSRLFAYNGCDGWSSLEFHCC